MEYKDTATEAITRSQGQQVGPKRNFTGGPLVACEGEVAGMVKELMHVVQVSRTGPKNGGPVY